MRGQNTIIINGKVYDALTGLPVAAPTPVAKKEATPKPPQSVTVTTPYTPPVSTARACQSVSPTKLHRTTQKSATLRRDILPAPQHRHQTPVHHARSARHPGAVTRSEMISKFAPHPQPLPKAKVSAAPKTSPAKADITPKPVQRAHRIHADHKHKPAAKPAVPAKALKEKLIAERLATAPTAQHGTHLKKARRPLLKSQPRLASVLTASFALIVLGGYFTYLNMPGISVRVAAAQAGVEAQFPEYRPNGYSLDGPVGFAPGEVSIGFKANGGTKKFTLNQTNSTWDSQAVLDNYVAKHSDSYLVSSEQGLTVYTYGSNAAWVNGGILYTIEGDAPLTTDQILGIAASL